MILSPSDQKLFFKLYIPLLGFANHYDGSRKKRRMDKAREILFGNPAIIEEYSSKNPDNLKSEKLEIVSSWRKFIKGTFIAIGDGKTGTNLMFVGRNKPVIYRALGLTEEIMDFMEPGIGTMFDGILLPWKSKIIWDGLCSLKRVILGRNYMHSFQEDYKGLKRSGEIITSLE